MIESKSSFNTKIYHRSERTLRLKNCTAFAIPFSIPPSFSVTDDDGVNRNNGVTVTVRLPC